MAAVAAEAGSRTGDPVALPAGPRTRARWKPWAVGAVIAVLIAVLASRSSSTSVAPVGSLTPTSGQPLDPRPGEPGEIRITPPAGMDGKQTRDWNKIVEELERGHYEGARHKLREFEDKYGQTDETRALGPQLDALGPDIPRSPDRRWPESRGRGKKHRDD